MKRKAAPLFGTALAFLLFGGTGARADFVSFSYSWTTDTFGIGSDVSGTSTISMTNIGNTLVNLPTNLLGDPSDPVNKAATPINIVASNLGTTTSLGANDPADTFSTNAPPTVYTLTLTIKAGNDTLTQQFQGYFQGQVSGPSPGGVNTLTPTFLTAGTQELDSPDTGLTFKAALTGVTLPPGPGSPGVGALGATLEVWGTPGNGQGGGGGPDSPEPSTLVLSCLGLSFLGAKVWRRRTRKEGVPA